MNILVTGANGQLGNEMRILSKGSKSNFLFTDIAQQDAVETTLLDITDLDSVRDIVIKNNIACIVNCAAYTNVDKAETDKKFCETLNAIAPLNLAHAIKEVNGLLIHISTDYVYGGNLYNTPCHERLSTNPTGVYGRTKLAGEQNVIATGCKSVIIRTAWLYSEFGKNFVKTMLGLTSTKPEIKVVFDQVGTPTYALDLAKVIVTVIDDYQKEEDAAEYTKTGVYHFSNEGVCSWFDFTKMIAMYSNHNECNILPCHSDEFPSPVARPFYSVLDKTKIKKTFGINIPYWVDALKECLGNLKNKE